MKENISEIKIINMKKLFSKDNLLIYKTTTNIVV
jgi:hypothetical protein